jgi:catechol 2,3-dioxygenase-like lactoylglutathione lyase family enzyme
MPEDTLGASEQTSRLAEAPIAPTCLHHIGLRTAHFQQMQEFYLTVLGVHPTFEVQGLVSFSTFDQAHHRLAIFYNPSSTESVPPAVGMHHVAFAYDSIDNLMRVYQRLKRKGILPHRAMNHGPNTSFYYQDPDRNSIELQVDNVGPDPDKRLEFLRALHSNPAGMPINPERYLAAWQAGATQKELHERSYAGEFVEGTPPLLPLSQI